MPAAELVQMKLQTFGPLYSPSIGCSLGFTCIYGKKTVKSDEKKLTKHTSASFPVYDEYPAIAWMVGRGQQALKSLSHPNLCAYIDFMPSPPDKVITVSECYDISLEQVIRSEGAEMQGFRDKIHSVGFWRDMLDAVAYLHDHGVLYRNLNPSNVLLTQEAQLKLFDYGLYFVTEEERWVDFSVGKPEYHAPELLLTKAYHEKADVWAIGMLLLEVLSKRSAFSSLDECLAFNESLWASDQPQKLVNEFIETRLNSTENYELIDIMKECLVFSMCDRKTEKQLLKHLSQVEVPEAVVSESAHSGEDLVENCQLPLSFAYHLWKLSGGDIGKELQLQMQLLGDDEFYPIENLPKSFRPDEFRYHQHKVTGRAYRDHVFRLPFERVSEAISSSFERIEDKPLLPKQVTEGVFKAKWDLKKVQLGTIHEVFDKNMNSPEVFLTDLPFAVDQLKRYMDLYASYPLSVREKDPLYQLIRLKLFAKLIITYPASLPVLRIQASIDIPPFLRGKVWSCLLELEESDRNKYARLNKELEHPIDRQIEVDLPRCHQYHPLLRNPQGLWKMRRLLKAWVLSSEKLVYWQGLDSICAAFLVNNFNDEASCFICLQKFIHRFLPTFFSEDNSSTIKLFLSLFRQMISFHDPELGNHLTRIGFLPDLYAIPWFLTFFTHVFSLFQIPQIWDKLFALDPMSEEFIYPILVGLALLRSMRSILMGKEFNECIHVFADVGGVDLSSLVEDAVRLLYETPPSLFEPLAEFVLPGSYGAGDELFSPTRMTVLPKISSLPIISVQDFKTLDDVLILDLRPRDHFQKRHIIGSWCLYPSLIENREEKKEDGFDVIPPAVDIRFEQAQEEDRLEQLLINDATQRYQRILKRLKRRSKYCILVGGSDHGLVQQIGNELVAVVKGLCVLNGGIEADVGMCCCEGSVSEDTLCCLQYKLEQ